MGIATKSSVEAITFNGVTYRRYPESPRLELRNYHLARGGKRLHRAVWEHNNGPIPEGHHVHHKDGNTLNNDPENLECLSNLEHRREHWNDERAEWQRKHIASIRPLASAWHGSEAGLAWHSENGKRCWESREPTEATCQHCGDKYKTFSMGRNRFCSNNCKSASRRASGADEVDRACVWCGNAFRVNKYSKQTSCSRSCGKRHAYRST